MLPPGEFPPEALVWASELGFFKASPEDLGARTRARGEMREEKEENDPPDVRIEGLWRNLRTRARNSLPARFLAPNPPL